MTRIMISAGEASGDIHAAALTKEILKQAPNAEVYGMGGDGMAAAGGEVIFDIKEHGVMGLVEIIRKLPALLRLRSDFAKLMDERRPDCLVTIDYPGFNMRLAKVARAKGIPVVSFIPPSAWAWRKGRAKKVARLADKVASIFPFEYEVYKEAGANVEFVGHPLVDIVKTSLPSEMARQKAGKQVGRPLVLLMPGSRLQEVQSLLPDMLKAAALIAKQMPNVDFTLPRAATIPEALLQEHLGAASVKVKIVEGDNYDVMSAADAALATSGTVTLEAALCHLPCVIVYKTAALTAFIVRRLLNISDIGLPNIVAGKRIIPELLQENATPENMAKEVVDLLQPAKHSEVLAEIDEVVRKLGEPGAVMRVAELILKVAGEKR
ncbi:MAG TPA: lipid-A-disaccharide synthase [Candidatus Avacidaminococcus intestinavium]|uniref:Lipid-A-disaccharide synthase n=1 Tax=Candidatus Avacidaminococcus intestinavium TaxID=2840684 RepID=A0A9D1SKS1_9FIRM|nr:lipid-A-disaccharide synthase [Candidatus Avacidaminococcus intestinavium]